MNVGVACRKQPLHRSFENSLFLDKMRMFREKCPHFFFPDGNYCVTLPANSPPPMDTAPEMAIIDSNMLTCIGLRRLIEQMMPFAIVRTFNTFEQFMRDTPDMYVHYFISAQILLKHNAFFVERKNKTIVMTNGTAGMPQASRFHTLNIYQSERDITRSLLQLQQGAHGHGCHLPHGHAAPRMSDAQPAADPNGLSPREIEVLVLIARGMINKEIAHHLCISLTTVISHRKNIMEKLNVHSVSGLTIYAVMNGYIEADRI